MRTLLEAGLRHYNIEPEPELCEKLLTYLALLNKWNRAYNLTAVTDPEEMLRRHVLDSLAIHAYIEGNRCLDVGTGPGLPGLILALLQTDKHWTLLDSSMKKVRFLRHVKMQLKMNNLDIVQSRVETYRDTDGFATIVCRAFSSLYDFHHNSHHLLINNGVLLAMKANVSEDELRQVRPHIKRLEKIALDVFDSDAERCLIRMTD